jgi:hypothetical protein
MKMPRRPASRTGQNESTNNGFTTIPPKIQSAPPENHQSTELSHLSSGTPAPKFGDALEKEFRLSAGFSPTDLDHRNSAAQWRIQMKPNGTKTYFVDFFEEMVRKANEHHHSINIEEIKEIIHEYDVVFGVYQDYDKAGGVGLQIIKGRPLLETCAMAPSSLLVRIEAIRCIDVEQAVAMSNAFGDGRFAH